MTTKVDPDGDGGGGNPIGGTDTGPIGRASTLGGGPRGGQVLSSGTTIGRTNPVSVPKQTAPKGIQFEPKVDLSSPSKTIYGNYELRYAPPSSSNYPQVTAHFKDQQIGRLTWTPDSHADLSIPGVVGTKYTGRGTVRTIGVDPAHQRKGVATAMWNMAIRNFPDLEHTSQSGRTPDGKSWIESLSAKSAINPAVSKFSRFRLGRRTGRGD